LPGEPLSRESGKSLNQPALHPGIPSMVEYVDIIEGGGRRTVIYLIYKDGEILVETDDIEYVRSYMSKNEECSVRDARTGKKIPLE
jgi:hypothetical protein